MREGGPEANTGFSVGYSAGKTLGAVIEHFDADGHRWTRIRLWPFRRWLTFSAGWQSWNSVQQQRMTEAYRLRVRPPYRPD